MKKVALRNGSLINSHRPVSYENYEAPLTAKQYHVIVKHGQIDPADARLLTRKMASMIIASMVAR